MFKNPFKKKEEEVEVPESWVEEATQPQSETGLVKLKRVTPWKINLPGGRLIKGGLAWVLILLNIFGFISCATLGANSLPLLLYFIINTWMLREYLYETRDTEVRYKQ